MNANEESRTHPLKYAWPLPLFLVSSAFLGITAVTIPRPEVFQYWFPVTYLIYFSVMAALALSFKFMGKKRNDIPRWIFVSNCLLGFGGPILAFIGAVVSFAEDH